MLLRVLASVPAPVGRRVGRLLEGEPIRLRTVRGALAPVLARDDADVLLVDRSRLGSNPDHALARLRAAEGAPEIIVLWDLEDPAARAGLLASGAVAVLNTSLEDRALAEAMRALLARRREAAVQRLRAQRGGPPSALSDFVSQSPEMQRLLVVARRMVDSEANVLILGETGVGKERLARAIHDEGPRRDAPFVAINTGAVPEALLESELFGHEEGAFTGAVRGHRGLFELAHGGTLFLDEIGDTPPAVQVKLLRALQDRRIRPLGAEADLEVDVRVIAATNRDLPSAMRSGSFRPDLFYRLGVVALNIPPLRERRADVPDLVQNHLAALCARLNRRAIDVSDTAMAALTAYDWPGNVRELVNVLERAVLLGDGPRLELRDLPAAVADRPPAAAGTPAAGDAREPSYELARARVLADFDRTYFQRLLQDCQGRVGLAAARSGLSPRTLFAKLRRLGLRKTDFRPPRPGGSPAVSRAAPPDDEVPGRA
ncbi:MAG: sigma 54-interacting transcriptional regulator [Planctomycetota bacterium]